MEGGDQRPVSHRLFDIFDAAVRDGLAKLDRGGQIPAAVGVQPQRAAPVQGLVDGAAGGDVLRYPLLSHLKFDRSVTLSGQVPRLFCHCRSRGEQTVHRQLFPISRRQQFRQRDPLDAGQQIEDGRFEAAAQGRRQAAPSQPALEAPCKRSSPAGSGWPVKAGWTALKTRRTVARSSR